MTKTGLFEVKRSIKQKIYFHNAKREDNRRRKEIEAKIMSMHNDWLSKHETVDVIVSMTSYGKRVEKFAAYALFSILQQTFVPKRIVLNLDKTKWNDENIPNIIKKLKLIGVTIQYVCDEGPYTKFLPTLKMNSNDIIITVDDDIYYDNMLVEELYEAYMNSNKQSIICRNGARLLKIETKYLPYMEQPHISTTDDAPGIPFGVSGVLYPPHIFDDEIFNSSVYKKICPSTDDLWFGIMALRNNVYVKYVHNNSWRGIVVDKNEEFNQVGSTAMHFSNDEKANTIFKNLIDYYHL